MTNHTPQGAAASAGTTAGTTAGTVPGAVPAGGHAMTCMEIWGGNDAIENTISSPGIDAWVLSRPYEGDDEGGDIHYVSMCGAGRISRFMVADVSGHGSVVSEAARMLRGIMRRNINTLDNSRFVRALNEAFQSESTGGRFATAIVATYFTPTDELLVVNAGHPRPLLRRARTGSWELLTPSSGRGSTGANDAEMSDSNLPLGIITPTEFEQFAVKLEHGDVVLVYTDGLIEASGPDGRQLGEPGLLRLASGLDASRPDRLAPELVRAVEAHQGGGAIRDDVTVLALHHNAGEPPRYSVGEHLTALAKAVGLIRV